MGPDARDVAAESDLVARAVEVAVQRLGFSREEARERLAMNAAELHLDPASSPCWCSPDIGAVRTSRRLRLRRHPE